MVIGSWQVAEVDFNAVDCDAVREVLPLRLPDRVCGGLDFINRVGTGQINGQRLDGVQLRTGAVNIGIDREQGAVFSRIIGELPLRDAVDQAFAGGVGTHSIADDGIDVTGDDLCIHGRYLC